jgi:hypothetical protein
MGTNVGAKKRAGIVLIVIGIILLVIALAPGVAGVSSAGFSAGRIGGLAVGVVVALAGLVLTRKKGHRTEPPA